VPTPVVPVASTTTNVTTTVVDGALQNALVCVDKNLNGVCDAGETQGRTDAAGNVTLAVPNADVGLYPIIAMVGTDAVDADNGPVLTAYTLTAPAGKPAVVSPLTTLVHQTMQSTGSTAVVADLLLQAQTGVTVSLFTDFTTPAAKAAAVASTSPNAATVARMVVVAAQAQNTAAAAAVGTAPVGGTVLITQADLNKAITQKILEMLPSILAIVTNPANSTPAAIEAALKAALTPAGSLATSVLTPAAVQIAVGMNKAPDVAVAAPAPGFNVGSMTYTSAGNWATRVFSGSTAQVAPVNNLTRFIDRRAQSVSGAIANWNYGGNPQNQANLHWTGSAWENCALNFESTTSLPDANGIRTTNYCNNYSNSTNTRSLVDVSGLQMVNVYSAAVAAGYTDMNISAAGVALLGTTVFPTGSFLRYQNTTDLAKAFVYGPGTGNKLVNYSPQVSAGGNSRVAGVACNITEFTSELPGTIPTTTLEGMVAAFSGQPCEFNQDFFISGGVTFYEGGALNAAAISRFYGPSTLGIATIGNVSLAAAPTSFYTGNKYIRVGFQGGGVNPVTYYSCDQRAVKGWIKNCQVIGSGNYTITSLTDGSRVMTLSNPPATALSSNRAFVERNGRVYYGFVDKLTTTKAARLTTTAANALFTQLAMPPIDAEMPLALTATSYQGTWEATDPAGPAGNGDTITLNSDGSASCKITATGVAYTPCVLTVSNAATGAFVFQGGNPNNPTGTLDFLTGIGSGFYLPYTGNPGVATPGGVPTAFTIKRR
jgi:trimeric autotransporter adhesin